MNRFETTKLLILLGLLALTASACGGGGGNAPVPGASPSPIVATRAPLFGTDTPVPADTPPVTSVPTIQVLPQELTKAVSDTKGVQAVRFEVASTATFTQDGKQVTQQGTSVKGEGSGADQNLTFSTPNLATGEVETYEMIKVGDQSYVKGLSFSPKVDANTWYQLASQQGSPQGSTTNPQGILSSMNEGDFLSLDFKPAGSGNVDAQSCNVWTSQNLALAKEFGTLSINPDIIRQLTAVDTFQVKLWTCPDGYMHQVQGLITGHDPGSPAEKASVEFSYHFYDFGAKITIAAPPNPQPVPVLVPVLTATP
jgi:hypothetical protein